MTETISLTDLPERFLQNFRQILEPVSNANATPIRVALAFSGGLDSSALLALLKSLAHQLKIELYAFHINHGISPNSDSWQSFCQKTAAANGICFDSRKLRLNLQDYGSVEAMARQARYKALGDMCRQHHINLLLTAHHMDDQLETSLMNLFNGSGIYGMAGMQMAKSDFKLLENPTVSLIRPLINVTRQSLAEFACQQKIAHIEDESNQNLRFRRNLLRNKVIPDLELALPGVSHRLMRSISHMQSGKRLLQQMAEGDFNRAQGRFGLKLCELREFSDDRLDNLLRYWFDKHSLPMPSLVQLIELKKQILTSRADAQVEFHLPNVSVYIEAQEAVLAPRVVDVSQLLTSVIEFEWAGEAQLEFPEFFGRLRFVPSDSGLAEELLSSGKLQLHFRRGGERLSLGLNRPSRDLRRQYQSLDIPYWQRKRLPLLSLNDKLLFAAGLGVNGKFIAREMAGYQLIWESDLLYCK